MQRGSLILLLGWVLLLGPALCVSGVMLHPCDCPAGAICAHESECSLDPCEDAVLRDATSVRTGLILAPIADLPTVSSTRPVTTVERTQKFREIPDRIRLPYPPTDLPLLI